MAKLASDDTDRIKRDIEHQIEARLHDAVGDLYRSLGEAVERVGERLREDDEGKPLVFRDSMIENFRGLVDVVPRLNIFGDDSLARLCEPVKDKIAGVQPDSLRPSRTFDPAARARVFFEEVLRENLDLGRPDHVQLIFSRRINRRTPSRYRTRVIPDGVIPSLHVDYKHSRIKQYYKESRTLRTETVINDAYDFGIGRRLGNLEDLQKIGFAANRRLLRVQSLSHDTLLGSEAFENLHRPAVIDQRRVPALRFGDLRVHAVLACLLFFNLLPMGFANRQLRELAAPPLGLESDEYRAGRATYDLRRLRMRGLIERIPNTNRYRVTEAGQRIALCYCRVHRRALGPALSALLDKTTPTELARTLERFDRQIDRLWRGQRLQA